MVSGPDGHDRSGGFCYSDSDGDRDSLSGCLFDRDEPRRNAYLSAMAAGARALQMPIWRFCVALIR
ncbi:hypothetical protein HZA40_02190 [Candidatus Peregrinibacteria bacterium]|nr:hypothetical protein [Candidatus Peregrinibacteria bacterium]